MTNKNMGISKLSGRDLALQQGQNQLGKYTMRVQQYEGLQSVLNDHSTTIGTLVCVCQPEMAPSTNTLF
jgi:hypothetical protein